MPELPEVETITRGLQKELTNKTIKKVQVKTPILVKKPQINEFLSKMKNARILEVKRRGKYIIIILKSDYQLIIHLGMSGRLEYQPNNGLNVYNKFPGKQEKHNHLFFFFEDNSRLVYNDVRKFGKIWFLNKDEKLLRIANLGFEPLDEEFTFTKFSKLLKNCNKNIKMLLMDQKKIAGIGNIYANEILFHSRVHPLRKANLLSEYEAKKVYLNIKKILLQAIDLRGTTMIDESYIDLQGNKGSFGEVIKVYGKKNGICPVCGHPLETIRIENRSTFVCPKCQK
jgi:formamidopyrimidine-DNA glycosylase